MARPKKNIDAEEVYKLAKLGCKNEEIAAWFNCTADTIERRFAPELAKGKSEMKMSLRRWQLRAAENGNASLLIWLGKQILGQRDNDILSSEEIKEIEIKVTKYDQNKS